ncbi:MAG: TetR/AcrR family transcriptional regulator [Chromatiales bacterium]|jgi:TetR/AcrR family transcriptional repressor of nem operon
MSSGTDTRRRIVDAARDLIYARSYSDVGVQSICGEAGVKKGSFYHFFPSKRDLTLAVVDELMATFRAHLGRAFEPDVPPMARFDRFVRLTYDLQRDLKAARGCTLGCPFGNLAVEMSTQDEILRRRLGAVFAELQGFLEQAVAEAVERGEMPPVDVKATAQAMFAFIEGVMLLAKTGNDPELILRLGPALREIRVAPERP